MKAEKEGGGLEEVAEERKNSGEMMEPLCTANLDQEVQEEFGANSVSNGEVRRVISGERMRICMR